jgi:hypothetical protein
LTFFKWVAGQFNRELFNPKLQPWIFNPKLFNHELLNGKVINHEVINHELFNHELFNYERLNHLGLNLRVEKSGIIMSSFLLRRGNFNPRVYVQKVHA